MRKIISIPKNRYTVEHWWKTFEDFPEPGTKILFPFEGVLVEALVLDPETICVLKYGNNFKKDDLIRSKRRWTVLTSEMEAGYLVGKALDHSQKTICLSSFLMGITTSKLQFILGLYVVISLARDLKTLILFITSIN